MWKLLVVWTAFVLGAASAAGQRAEEPRLAWGGTLQVRASLGVDEGDAARIGVGLRRARLRLRATPFPKLSLFAQVEGTGPTPVLLDARAEYALTDALELRAGRFVTPQPAAFAPSIHSRLDGVDRPLAARRWAAQTIGADGRDFAVELRYHVPALTVEVALSNGDGSWDRQRGNVREDLGAGSVTRQPDAELSGALSGSFAWRPEAVPGLDVGGYTGINTSRNPNTARAGIGRAYGSYSAHVYWGRFPGSQPLRLKAEVLGLRYEATDEVEGQHLWGGDVLAAARVARGAEVYARVDWLDEGVGAETIIQVALGGSLSPSARLGRSSYGAVRVTAELARRLGTVPEGDGRFSAVVQAQVVF